MRSHYCAELNELNVGEEVELVGWVNSHRDHGGVIFIDLRDRSGIIQIVADPADSKKAHEVAEQVKDEYVIKVKGKVRLRGEGLENPKLKTGKIEVVADEIVIENKSEVLPFQIGDKSVNEELRLKYRYLDLRDPDMLETFILRSKVVKAIRDYFDKEGFIDVETPVLTKSTPEGARDYLVPSRIHPGEFYALPQSPQLFKQILMVAGFDKYYQIAKCFRDEDLRADRQPEFTQVDVEMSFVEQDDVIKTIEGMVKEAFAVAGIDVKTPIKRISYHDAMEKYGSDKPDLRYDLAMVDVIDEFVDSNNEIFAEIAKDKKNNRFKALKVPGGDKFYSRKMLKELENFVRKFGAKGLAYIQVKEEGLKGPILKFMSEESLNRMINKLKPEVGDIIFFGAGDKKTVLDYMGRLRAKIAKDMNLYDPKAYEFVWVVDFPMFEKDENGNPTPLHHPFTMPNMETWDEENFEDIKSIAYDLVLNGYEIGGGSIRIHKEEIQEKVFKLLGIDEMDAREKFGFLLDALKFGAPPHGGFALGLDRVIMLMRHTDNIRDVIAFPKTQKAQCLLTGAPGEVEKEQLKELHIRVKKPKTENE
ncbi:aspartate--tRNA ligase [Caminibacter pacificus]|uniref:Aspartate--tRNA(Asp/Asn) ligase n=1 Tax=Caminibacter pacificus TaxID=1424653 RepID=A0AAJ4REA7_9BACT|nr:aspartate--tRNA ligase [Caminibacter pacificus]NPA88553.1 aspartate--tRNA ligase [Campylobacterota bacterium]QCI28295.1 aspartate--tRNA ligase [Caminibacter pacificus]ROR40991.1 aspartyl-tRNA synthetase [Caminibacter pacificus]